MRIDDDAARRFYEIETLNQQWSVRQLQRQVGSSLYERLALSRDKDKVMASANEGQTVQNPSDICSVSEEQLRRIQIRETILSHIERERQLFLKGIKVLSLFFIDEVAKYKQYDEHGNATGGIYAKVFEEEYKAIAGSMQLQFEDSPEYLKYLDGIPAEKTHAGYFSIDRKSGRMIDSKLGDKKERTSDDADAYDLIMKDKERLLDLHEPVRFIFIPYAHQRVAGRHRL